MIFFSDFTQIDETCIQYEEKMNDIFLNDEICMTILLQLENIVDIKQLCLVNKMFYETTKYQIKHFNNVQFALINLAKNQKICFSLKMKPLSMLFSYHPSHQLFAKGGNKKLFGKLVCYFHYSEKKLIMYNIDRCYIVTFDGNQFECKIDDYDDIQKYAITINGILIRKNHENLYFLNSIVLPDKWQFYRIDCNEYNMCPHFVVIGNTVVLKLNIYRYVKLCIVKIDNGIIHFVASYISSSKSRFFDIINYKQHFHYFTYDFSKLVMIGSHERTLKNIVYRISVECSKIEQVQNLWGKKEFYLLVANDFGCKRPFKIKLEKFSNFFIKYTTNF